MANMLKETLGKFQDFRYFSLLESKRAERVENDEKKLKDEDAKQGADVVQKLQDNLERFKSAAGDKIIKYKEFWEENKKAKESFDETGEIYKMFDSDYVVGVLTLPDEAISDEEINSEIEEVDKDKDAESPEEEAEETPEHEESETPEEEAEEAEEHEEHEEDIVKESLNEDEDINLDFEEPDEKEPKLGEEPELEEPAVGDEETPEIPDETGEEPVEGDEPPEGEGDDMDFKEEEGTTECFVVYNMSGSEREEVFRTDSTSVIDSFKDFFENTFKGAMKEQILKFKQAQEDKKKEAELAAREKKRAEQKGKLDQFMKA